LAKTIEQLGEINRNKTVEINLQGQVENETDISEDILSDMQSMLNIDENVCTLKDKPILESSIDEKLCITEEKPNLESNMDKNFPSCSIVFNFFILFLNFFPFFFLSPFCSSSSACLTSAFHCFPSKVDIRLLKMCNVL
jgi:hypothetical protein